MITPNTLLHGRYLVIKPLGQGGMGAVYHARDRKFGNEVAIKETFFSDPQLRAAFLQEAKLLNGLRHGALPVVMDFFSEGERQFLVMQYIAGKDLEQCLREKKAGGQGPFAVSQVVRWADQLLDALEYLHSQEPPVIHRDIKPQNMKLTPRGEIILLDFGLAKEAAIRQSKSSHSIRGYTPNYASIEQMRGSGTDARSDIYSVGAMLYHLLTGELPPDALTRIAALLLGQPDPLRPIAEVNPGVPETIAQFVEKAVSPHPDSRFESAALMRQALRNACSNGSGGGAPASLHRTPTLIDDPIFANIEAAAAISIGGVASLRSQPDSPATPSQPASHRRQTMLFGALLLAVMAGAGFGIVKFQKWGNSLLARVDRLAAGTQANAGGPALAIPMRVEAMRYYLELVRDGGDRERVTGLMPLAAGSRFKFHFRPSESGYLYILSMSGTDSWQTFLTDLPMPASGVVTNRVEAGREYQFPDGGQWFMMHREAEATPFIVIFSPYRLSSPSFLASQSGHQLDQPDIQALDAFRKNNSGHPVDLVAITDNSQPAVVAQVSADRQPEEIVIFNISLRKKQGN